MKVIILSAGMGSRLNYELPKSLIDIDGRKILDITIEQLNLTGVVNNDITLITGYKDYLFSEYNINKVQNKKFKISNQVHSIYCAKSLTAEKDVLVIYGDVLFEYSIIMDLINSQNDIVVPSFVNFKELWNQRGDIDYKDLESFSVDDEGKILDIGNNVNDIDDVQGQFMGIVYFGNYKFSEFINYYKDLLSSSSTNKGLKIETTTFLNYLINNGVNIQSINYEGYFMELDNKKDLEIIKSTLNF